ncbi:MAG: antibiotic biosynthesis monooxygenase [Janthinobacterium lividum]
MIIVIARIEVDPTSIPRLRPLLDRMTQLTWHESGCLSYSIAVESESDGIISLVERWESEAAFHAYLATPAMVAFKVEFSAEQIAVDARIYDISGERMLPEAKPPVLTVVGRANGISAA